MWMGVYWDRLTLQDIYGGLIVILRNMNGEFIWGLLLGSSDLEYFICYGCGNMAYIEIVLGKWLPKGSLLLRLFAHN
jgi:hypothetical protein